MQEIITYFYKDSDEIHGAGYRVDARPINQRTGFSEFCKNKDDALRLTAKIQANPSKYV